MSRRKTVQIKQLTLDVPKDKIEEYREAFRLFDKDGGGTISIDEIAKIMKSFGNPISKDDLRAMISKLDTSGDDEITFEEFVSLMQVMEVEEEEPSSEEEDEIIRAFKTFDKEKTGKISVEEFKYIMTQLGDVFNPTEWNLLMTESELDEDDQEIDYREFVKAWRER